MYTFVHCGTYQYIKVRLYNPNGLLSTLAIVLLLTVLYHTVIL